MHLLREGQFGVASTFLTDATQNPPRADVNLQQSSTYTALEHKFGIDSLKSDALREQFANMYHILHELKNERNLLPAIGWARANSAALEARGSNLEFELEKLQFIWLFMSREDPSNDPRAAYQGQRKALQYARKGFMSFEMRYMREIQQLIGAMAFCANLQQSPYRRIFCNNDAWGELVDSFTREFCSLLGLSADSPLYIAVTAGAIALPTLLKLQTIMKEKRTEWTTQNELPVSQVWVPHFIHVLILALGRNTPTASLSVPLHLRMPHLERADDGREPADDDTVRPRDRSRVAGTAREGR